ncbi:4'-phosphopantetheinyl transferase family protein [Streptomyces sp. NPDC055287]
MTAAADERAPAGGTPPGPELVWQRRVSAYADEAARHERILDPDERARLSGFRLGADRDRYRVAHVALRRLLGERLGTDPAAVPIGRLPCTGCGGPHGRPVVPGAPVHFSLSHAGDVVIVALASAPVGVDVEEVPRPDLAAATATTALHPAELRELAALAPGARGAAFARCWTRKEAYLKATGTGLNVAPSTVLSGTGQEPAPAAGRRVADLPTFPGYAAAVATRDETTTTTEKA